MACCAIVAVVVAIPLTEEFLFRGLVFTVLRRHLPRNGAILMSATLFTMRVIPCVYLILDRLSIRTRNELKAAGQES